MHLPLRAMLQYSWVFSEGLAVVAASILAEQNNVLKAYTHEATMVWAGLQQQRTSIHVELSWLK